MEPAFTSWLERRKYPIPCLALLCWLALAVIVGALFGGFWLLDHYVWRIA